MYLFQQRYMKPYSLCLQYKHIFAFRLRLFVNFVRLLL